MTFTITSENRIKIRKTILPLKLIIAGGFLLVIDFNFFFFDLFNDTVGWVLLTIGVIFLTFLHSSKRYEYGMTFVSLVAILSVGVHLLSLTTPDVIEEYIQYYYFLSGIQSVAIIFFCISMYWFCEELGLNTIAKDWQSAYLLFTFFLIIPGSINSLILNVLYPDYSLSNVMIILIIVIYMLLAIIPLIHIFRVTKKMLNIAKDFVPKDFSSKGAI